jgi:hypothetical protein
MPASLTTISSITKEIYEAPLRKQLNDEVVALQRIAKPTGSKANVITDEVGAKYVTFPVHYKRNSGIGARREMETLPTAGQQGTAAARVGLKYLYGAIQLSGQVLKLADTKYQTFISALELETSRIREDLSVDLNRQVYGTGSGALAVTSSTTALNTAVITSGINNLQLDMVVDIYTAANLAADSTAKATARNVTAIVNNGDGTGTVTFDGAAVTFTNLDVFVRTGSANREWAGLGAMVDNNTGVTYENILPSSVGVWLSEINTTGGAISETAITKMTDRVNVNGGKTSLLLTSQGVRRSYANLLMQLRQFVNKTEFAGGFSGLSFTTDRGDIPLVSDKDCPLGTIYGLDESHIKLYRDADWSFMDKDGNMWYRVPTKDGYGATLYQYSELATDRRNAHFKMTGITES